MKRDSRRILSGIPASPGLALGKIHFLERGKIPIPRYRVRGEDIQAEIRRFSRAVSLSRRQLERIKEKLRKGGGGEEYLLILDAHVMLLMDNILIRETKERIKGEGINAEWAFSTVEGEIEEKFHHLRDDYLRERADDLHFVCNRVLRNLLEKERGELEGLKEEVIVVAHYLSPADTALMDRNVVKGFATDLGGRNSHTAIMARSLEIPAVVGLENVTGMIGGATFMMVDGLKGEVIIDPTAREVEEFRRRRGIYEEEERDLLGLRERPAVTGDGVKVTLMANIDLAEEVASATIYGTEGIGMLRTEFLYMKREDTPTEEEHFSIYSRIVRGLAPLPVTMRTLDLGGDKIALRRGEAALREDEEPNPALGFRAIRFCLEHQDIFRAQLRGMIRASAVGDLRILIPMISGVEEILEVKRIVEEIKGELRRRGEEIAERIPLGIMLEVPSACLTCDIMAPHVDFFSIGTNDLVQYALAIDRLNNRLFRMNDPLHPAVLRMIMGVVETAKRFGVPLSMCGEMAGDPLHVPLLVGMGIRELSMNMASIPRVKKVLMGIRVKDCEEAAMEVMKMVTGAQISSYLQEKFGPYLPGSGG